MLTDGIEAFLNANTTITSLANSIRPIPAPALPAAYPCVTYQVVSDVPRYSLTGEAGPITARIVFTCIANSYLAARTLGLAIKGALSAYTGRLPDGTFVNETEILSNEDGFNDGSRYNTTSVHVSFYYS